MAISSKEKKKYINIGRREVDEGLPAWFGTFADMMTLLFAFFVLLAAISTIDPVKLQEMADSLGKSVGTKVKKKGAMTLADVKKAVNQMVKKEKMEKSVDVTTGPKGLTISISSDISFASGSANLKPSIFPILEKIAPTIVASHFMVAVEGHTDSELLPEKYQEKYPTNWELSGARAAAVVRKLIFFGVNETRLQAVGYADLVPRDRPKDRIIDRMVIRKLNQTDIQKTRNRRVEITFLAIKI